VAKIDFRRECKHLYQPGAKAVVQVEVPPLRYLMIDGEGDPTTAPAYARADDADRPARPGAGFCHPRSHRTGAHEEGLARDRRYTWKPSMRSAAPWQASTTRST